MKTFLAVFNYRSTEMRPTANMREQALHSSWADEGVRPWHAHSRAYLLALVGFLGTYRSHIQWRMTYVVEGIFLFGYDTGLGGGVIALKTFQVQFGIKGYVGNAGVGQKLKTLQIVRPHKSLSYKVTSLLSCKVELSLEPCKFISEMRHKILRKL
jgi:hypothetical protein